MRKRKRILQASLAFASVVLTAYGGKLLRIAPPGEYEALFSGIVALLILAALGMGVGGLIKAIREWTGKDVVVRIIWSIVVFISVFAFAIATLDYYKAHVNYVVPYSDQKKVIGYVVIGDNLTPLGHKIIKAQATDTYPDILAGVGGMDKAEILWTRSGIAEAKGRLMLGYVIMIVSIGLMLFSAVELEAFGKLGETSKKNP